MGLFHIFISLVICSAVFTAAQYPENPRLVDQEFRKITVQWDPIANFNASTQSYQVEYELFNTPKYIVDSKDVTIGLTEPKITRDRLLIDSAMRFRIGVRNGNTDPLNSSPWKEYKTKASNLVGNIELPGKVRNIVIEEFYASNLPTQRFIWDVPANIEASNNASVKSIQYRIDVCNYNPLTQQKSNCATKGEFLSDVTSVSQNSRSKYANGYTPQYITLDRNREVAVIITPVALNKTDGPSEMKTTRLDPSTKPSAPARLRNGTIYANQLVVAWDALSVNGASYIVEYSIKGNSTKMNWTGTGQFTTFYGLRNGTAYEFRIAVNDSDNGTGVWSSVIEISTNNTPAPTSPPATTPSSSTILLPSYMAIVFVIFVRFFSI